MNNSFETQHNRRQRSNSEPQIKRSLTNIIEITNIDTLSEPEINRPIPFEIVQPNQYVRQIHFIPMRISEIPIEMLANIISTFVPTTITNGRSIDELINVLTTFFTGIYPFPAEPIRSKETYDHMCSICYTTYKICEMALTCNNGKHAICDDCYKSCIKAEVRKCPECRSTDLKK